MRLTVQTNRELLQQSAELAENGNYDLHMTYEHGP